MYDPCKDSILWQWQWQWYHKTPPGVSGFPQSTPHAPLNPSVLLLFQRDSSLEVSWDYADCMNKMPVLQSRYLINVVGNVWTAQRNAMFNELQGAELVIGADGRCDSMGHSAKYGSYTAMDLERNQVLNFELVQSNEVKLSTHMELRGLHKMVQLFQEFNLEVKVLVTDRHRQIQTDKRKPAGHSTLFDCWHVAKSIKKKLQVSHGISQVNSLVNGSNLSSIIFIGLSCPQSLAIQTWPKQSGAPC